VPDRLRAEVPAPSDVRCLKAEDVSGAWASDTPFDFALALEHDVEEERQCRGRPDAGPRKRSVGEAVPARRSSQAGDGMFALNLQISLVHKRRFASLGAERE
jgi:hypothetical protein